MQPLKQFWVAETVERDLADPGNPDNMISFKQVIDLDEKEEFPHEIINWLYNWKLQHYYIPTEYSSELTSFDELIPSRYTLILFFKKKITLIWLWHEYAWY